MKARNNYGIFQIFVTLALLSPLILLVNCSRMAFTYRPQNMAGQKIPPGNTTPPTSPGTVPPACTLSTTNTPIVTSLPPGLTQSMVTGICPAVGSNSDCTAVIIVTDTGVYLYYNPNQPSGYDGTGDGGGDDDTLIGVLNASTSTTISTLGLSSNNDIFGFDNDGIDTYIGTSSVTGATTIFATNKMDSTGYGGPNAYFSFQNGCTYDSSQGGYVSSLNEPAACNGGTVNFVKPIAPGQTAFFSLENALNSATACLATQIN